MNKEDLKEWRDCIIVAAVSVALVFSLHPAKKASIKQGDNVTKIDSALYETHHKIDSALYETHHKIDSMRYGIDSTIQDSLRNNGTYMRLVKNQIKSDSLKIVNDSLIDAAYTRAKKHSIFKVPHKNATVFTEFNEIPAVRSASFKYWKNKNQIAILEQYAAQTENPEIYVRRFLDSTNTANIRAAQFQIDSLLNQKAFLLSGKQK